MILLYLLLVVAGTRAMDEAGSIKCRIKCGVVTDDLANTKSVDSAQEIWEDLKYRRDIIDLHINFVPIRQRARLNMDQLIESYMEIGTTNVSAIIGPYQLPLATATEKFGVPYFVTSDATMAEFRPYNVISVFPNLHDITGVTISLVLKYRWEHVIVLYHDDEGARLVEKLVNIHRLRVNAWRLQAQETADNIRSNLLEGRKSGCRNVISVTSSTLTKNILTVAMHLSMLQSSYSWLIPSLDQNNEGLASFAYTEVNLTTFQLQRGTFQYSHTHIPVFEFTTVFDNLLVLYRGIMTQFREIGICQWAGRDQLKKVLLPFGETGATGHLAFTENFTRKGHLIDILSLSSTGLNKIGAWNSSQPAMPLRLREQERKTPKPVLRVTPPPPFGKRKLTVITILEPPFVMKRRDASPTDSDLYYGYCVDLMEEIAAMLDLSYELRLVKDGTFGVEMPGGRWTGIMGELRDGKAEIAVAPLTITAERESVIDFTKPFMNLGISIVMKQPTRQSHSLLQFLEPLSAVVWSLLLIVIIFISAVLFGIDRLSPDDQKQSDRLSLGDSIWFVTSSLVMVSTDVVPRSTAARIMSSFLWSFSLIIIASYTANLAAFLTISRFHIPINSVFDLSDQSKVYYGTVKNSQVSSFFEQTKISYFQKMWQFMSMVHPQSMVDHSDEGFDRVGNSSGDYAFLWDSPVVRHKLNRRCGLFEIGRPFASWSYGIAVPSGASYRDDLSMAILKLGEAGTLTQLEHKYWGHNFCKNETNPTGKVRESLNVDKIGGVFLILAFGVIASIAAAIVEYFYKRKRRSRESLALAPNRRKQLSNHIGDKMEAAAKPLCDGVTLTPPEDPVYLPPPVAPPHISNHVSSRSNKMAAGVFTAKQIVTKTSLKQKNSTDIY